MHEKTVKAIYRQCALWSVKYGSRNAPKNYLCPTIASLLGQVGYVIKYTMERNVCQPIFDPLL